jgi:hypothetical protein
MHLEKFSKLVIVCGVVASTGAYSAETFCCWHWHTLNPCEEIRIRPHLSTATAPNTVVTNVLLASPGFEERFL